jgi:hypothetical protein
MRVITLRNEANIAALVDRLFADLTPEMRKAAEASLFKANPHLACADAFKPGTVVWVPEVPGIKPKLPAANKDPRDDLIDRLLKAVSDYRARLTAGLKAENDEIKAQLELLKQRKIVDLLENVPGAKELAKELTDSLKQAAETLPQDMKRLDELFAQIEKDLSSLV